MKKQTHRHKQSFTLIELLIVIAIIAILAAVIVANVTSAQAQARDVRRTQDLDQLKTALEMYYLNNDSYPYPTDSDQGFCIEQNQSFKTLLIGGDYISSLPQDPLYNIDQCDNPFNLNCHCYIYRTETADKYKLFAKTEQQDFKPATQDGGKYPTHYEAYAPIQGANKIGLAQGWYEGGPYLSGIVGAWSFDEGFGTIAYDSSGNNNHGTLVNGPTWVDGKFGSALSFDGVNDYVEVPNSTSLDITDAITIEAWVKRLGDYHPQWNMLFCHRGLKYESGVYGGSSLIFKPYNASGTSFEVSTGTPLNIGQWYHITMIRNGTFVGIYIDGVLKGSRNDFSGDLKRANGNLYIGESAGYKEVLNGTIDEVRIYNRALTAEEIAANYAAGSH